jgi:predicted ATPase
MIDEERLKDDLVKVRTYIEENLRKTSTSGIPYIDLHDNKRSVLAKKNDIIFGRRGSGKSTLLGELKKNKVNHIEMNLENYKNITFPNIIIKILEEIFEYIKNGVKKRITIHIFKKAKLLKDLKAILDELGKLYQEEDSYVSSLTHMSTSEKHKGANIKVNGINASADISTLDKSEQTLSREMQFAKLDKIRKNLISYKNVLTLSYKFIYIDKPLYILLDDFYFIRIDSQPYLADVLHVLTKDTNIYKKIASIKHRSIFYIKDKDTYQGIEIGHDAIEIDLDYSLEDMDLLMKFYSQLLIEIFRAAHVSITENDMFGGAGLKQLCIASGGVTRDFLMLLSKCINEMIVNPGQKIGKEIVNSQSAAYMTNKFQSLEQEVSKNYERLERYLNYLKDEVLNKERTNCFLIDKGELDRNPEEKNAIRDLFDMRFIHLIDKNTSSAPSDGKHYEAYILDVGLYDFTRLRKFDQIEPGNKDDKSRKDKMRASPKISLEAMKSS